MNKKEEFVVNGKAYLKVQPCGMFTNQGTEYFLLHPYPIEPDWENEHERRFVVVPRKIVDLLEDTGDSVYAVARHVVVTEPWRIEYADMPFILIERAEIDLADIEHPVRDVNDVMREFEELSDELELDGFPY